MQRGWRRILNRGTATLEQTTVSGNTAAGIGGGIYNGNALTLRETTVTGNMAGCTGGGLYVATVLLFASTISGNTPNDRVDADNSNFPPCI